MDRTAAASFSTVKRGGQWTPFRVRAFKETFLKVLALTMRSLTSGQIFSSLNSFWTSWGKWGAAGRWPPAWFVVGDDPRGSEALFEIPAAWINRPVHSAPTLVFATYFRPFKSSRGLYKLVEGSLKDVFSSGHFLTDSDPRLFFRDFAHVLFFHFLCLNLYLYV